MGQNDKKIAELIDSIAHKREHGLRFPVMTGKVISVDEADMTAVVELSVDEEGVYTDGISINVVLEAVEGMYGIPEADSFCLVAEVNGPGKWELLKANKYKKLYGKVGGSEVMVKNDVIQFNDGGDGGLVQIQKLKANLDKIHDYIKSMLEPAIYTGMNSIGSGTGASGSTGATAFSGALTGQDIIYDNMENTKVKHG